MLNHLVNLEREMGARFKQHASQVAGKTSGEAAHWRVGRAERSAHHVPITGEAEGVADKSAAAGKSVAGEQKLAVEVANLEVATADADDHVQGAEEYYELAEHSSTDDGDDGDDGDDDGDGDGDGDDDDDDEQGSGQSSADEEKEPVEEESSSDEMGGGRSAVHIRDMSKKQRKALKRARRTAARAEEAQGVKGSNKRRRAERGERFEQASSHGVMRRADGSAIRAPGARKQSFESGVDTFDSSGGKGSRGKVAGNGGGRKAKKGKSGKGGSGADDQRSWRLHSTDANGRGNGQISKRSKVALKLRRAGKTPGLPNRRNPFKRRPGGEQLRSPGL